LDKKQIFMAKYRQPYRLLDNDSKDGVICGCASKVDTEFGHSPKIHLIMYRKRGALLTFYDMP